MTPYPPDDPVVAYCAPGLRGYAEALLAGETYRELIETPALAGRTDVILAADPGWYTRPPPDPAARLEPMTCDPPRHDATYPHNAPAALRAAAARRAAADARADAAAALAVRQPALAGWARHVASVTIPLAVASHENLAAAMGQPWAAPDADVAGDTDADAGPFTPAGYEVTAELAADFHRRTGLPVTVFTAAAPVRAGRLVRLLDGTTVMPFNPVPLGGTGHGVALADAATGGLVPVVLAGAGVSVETDPGTGQATVWAGGLAATTNRPARPDPGAIGDAAFAPRPRPTATAERDVAEEALERGEDPYEALAAYRRRPGPLADLPGAAVLVVAPVPGPRREAWRMTAVGVWFALYGEDAAWFLPEGDPARPERMTAAGLRARLAAR